MEKPASGGAKEEEAKFEDVSSGDGVDQHMPAKPDPKQKEEQKDEVNGDQKTVGNVKVEIDVPNNVDMKERNKNADDINEIEGGSNRSGSLTESRSKKSVRWSEDLVMESSIPRSSEDPGSRPYAPYSHSSDDLPPFNMKETMENVKDVFGRWRKKVGEATRKAEDLAGNTWQHLKTSPSFADAALGRIAQSTKVLAEGGYEKIFRQTFETTPEEQLQNSFACYLSTSAGPVMGVLYVSTAKIAFCSDNPLSYKADDKTEWSYYKVVIPLHQLKAVNPSSSRTNSAEKYIQVISVDDHEFWYMGFLNYDGAINCMELALQSSHRQAV